LTLRPLFGNMARPTVEKDLDDGTVVFENTPRQPVSKLISKYCSEGRGETDRPYGFLTTNRSGANSF